jgi:hypothetical protein
MDEPDEAVAREVLRTDEEDVVVPWEERVEVVEAGLDDTTAPLPEPTGGDEHREGR